MSEEISKEVSYPETKDFATFLICKDHVVFSFIKSAHCYVCSQLARTESYKKQKEASDANFFARANLGIKPGEFYCLPGTDKYGYLGSDTVEERTEPCVSEKGKYDGSITSS